MGFGEFAKCTKRNICEMSEECVDLAFSNSHQIILEIWPNDVLTFVKLTYLFFFVYFYSQTTILIK